MSQPEAVALATATTDGAPSVRMVLFKRADRDGFVFFTNYESRKGGELAANPRAALLFHWEPFGRQVRIEGPVVRTTREESEAYAHSRARGSQLSAAASPQSAVVERREILEERVAALDQQHAGAEVPVPDHWGGFRLTPETFEFWQHRATTDCTIACGTGEDPAAPGRSSGSRPKWSLFIATTPTRLIRTRGLASVAAVVAHVRADPPRGRARRDARRPGAGLQLPRRRALQRRDRAGADPERLFRRAVRRAVPRDRLGPQRHGRLEQAVVGVLAPTRAPPRSSTARSAGWGSTTST